MCHALDSITQTSNVQKRFAAATCPQASWKYHMSASIMKILILPWAPLCFKHCESITLPQPSSWHQQPSWQCCCFQKHHIGLNAVFHTLIKQTHKMYELNWQLSFASGGLCLGKIAHRHLKWGIENLQVFVTLHSQKPQPAGPVILEV